MQAQRIQEKASETKECASIQGHARRLEPLAAEQHSAPQMPGVSVHPISKEQKPQIDRTQAGPVQRQRLDAAKAEGRPTQTRMEHSKQPLAVWSCAIGIS